ncbi:helix-turn-helix transcriptional regulator [Paracoccus aestuariivivens]|uniref:Helix-turn-helix domain-containing protein n=1 Tax=Paracoccus aestuariivivens TaxID=1820333 RepID=A0A6L6JIV1_9RHOB|nr:AraC family transcriptional regulator [Paracoccus aestuariivivens]MTH80064.1 helix-turn-helix domain-containing protein [Paracoccus aestuariivivens]
MTGNSRSRDLTTSAGATDAADRKLLGAAITADVILEPSTTDPRPIRGFTGYPPPEVTKGPTIAPVDTDGSYHVPPTRPFTRGDGVRLMPLSGFIWGGQIHARQGSAPVAAAPRVRGDHVIILVIKGGAAVEFPRKAQLIGQGRVAFIPSGTAFSIHPPADTEGWALLLPPNLGTDLPIGFPLAFQHGLPHPADEALLEPAICALGHDRAPGPNASGATACHLGLLALALSRTVEQPQIHDPNHLHTLVARPLTENFLALAARHLADDRTIADMARELGCTQAQLDHACTESRGRTALELLYALRLEQAAHLLRDTDAPIPQIAQEVGYTSVGHFIRVFAAATGRSPEAFRIIAWEQPEAED